ncbi:MAG: DUF4395 family protein [Solirubrobacterales bacterium]
MDRVWTAHPFDDTDVIDERAPRTNQVVVGVVSLIGVVFGWPLAWALLALQLAVGLTFGRRYCLPCLAYFTLIQPRFGEGLLEDSRPPRLANQIGVATLTAAAAAWWFGAPTVGLALGALVAFLALLSAVTGFCAGCEIYRLFAHMRGVRSRDVTRIDPADLAVAGSTVVHFTHPLCSECHSLEQDLTARGERLQSVNVRERPDLARKYGILVVPTALGVGADGTVTHQIAP